MEGKLLVNLLSENPIEKDLVLPLKMIIAAFLDNTGSTEFIIHRLKDRTTKMIII